LNPSSARVYWHSSEDMSEVKDKSVKLLVCNGVYLGPKAGWDQYRQLYATVLGQNGLRVLRPDGFLVNIMTDQYRAGHCILRAARTTAMLESFDWRCVDVKVWQRKNVDLFQAPFTHVTVLVPPGAKHGRKAIKGKEWLRGVWTYPPMDSGKLNSWPPALCRLLVESFTEPGDLIVDPFAGTARLLGIAKGMGRHAIGYEIDKTLRPVVLRNLADSAGGQISGTQEIREGLLDV
jgi:hypothetical protein